MCSSHCFLCSVWLFPCMRGLWGKVRLIFTCPHFCVGGDSLQAPIPFFFSQVSVHSGSASCDNCGSAFPDKLCARSFPVVCNVSECMPAYWHKIYVWCEGGHSQTWATRCTVGVFSVRGTSVLVMHLCFVQFYWPELELSPGKLGSLFLRKASWNRVRLPIELQSN